jgi:hypothetical protein
MKHNCKCGYKTDRGTAFASHIRAGCKNEKYVSTVTCPCGVTVNVPPGKQGRKKFCSIECRNNNYVRPLGIKQIYTTPHPSWIKKGEKIDDKHPNWVGNDVGYNALHTWIHRKLGKACKCEDCGKTEAPKGKSYFFQWANISGNYKRDLTDWKQLCSVCHRKYDGITKLSKEEAKSIKARYRNGEKQRLLATEYNVDPATISNIVNDKIQYYAS